MHSFPTIFKSTFWLLASGFWLLACQSEPHRVLYLAAYTAPREAFRQINAQFEYEWKAKTGQTIRIKESYLSSGAQSRAVRDGFEADVVALALETDVDRLAQSGLITHDWRQAPNGGMLTHSVVAFAVRKGNPLHIKDWQDLIKPKVEVLTPNPKTSGGAQWNVLAAYQATKKMYEGLYKYPPPPSGESYLVALFRQVVAMDKGARESILTFERGLGDVALSYENEIFEGKRHGQDYELVVPNSTILIENPVALVDRYVDKHQVRPLAQAYLDFLFSPTAQRIFAEHGFRPVHPQVKRKFQIRFMRVPELFTIKDLGGWKKVMKDFFGEKGIFPRATEEAQK